MKLVEVYKHIRLDTNTVFYVGIGTSPYRKNDKHGRNAYWHNIVKLAGYRVELIEVHQSRREACKREIELISYYKALGQCEANLAAGGAGGRTGVKASEETLIKMSKWQRGKPKPQHSEATKKKMSKNSGRAIKCFCKVTGKVFNNIKDAATELNIKHLTLWRQLTGISKNKTTLEVLCV